MIGSSSFKILHGFCSFYFCIPVFDVTTNGLFWVTCHFFFFFFKHYLIINSVNKYLSTFYVPDIVRDAESIKVNRTQNPAQIEFKIW